MAHGTSSAMRPLRRFQAGGILLPDCIRLEILHLLMALCTYRLTPPTAVVLGR